MRSYGFIYPQERIFFILSYEIIILYTILYHHTIFKPCFPLLELI
jgi:hypothetical protein